MCKKEWICKVCGKSTKEVEYDYLWDIDDMDEVWLDIRDLHLECALNEKLIRKKKLEKINKIYEYNNTRI